MNHLYGKDFYKDRHQQTAYSANVVLSLLLDVLPPVRSAVALGCGVGTWLSILREKGVPDVQGLDGPWVDQGLLEIPKENFQVVDLTELPVIDGQYDLAISLEVAEHLPGDRAEGFVTLLTNAADFIVFAAAIPRQGGVGHVNEQWPDYWADLFAKRGFRVMDVVRRRIWNDKDIPVWYRQNILMFVKESRASTIAAFASGALEESWPLAVVHPDLYISKMNRPSAPSSVKSSGRLFLEMLKIHLKKRAARMWPAIDKS